MLKFFKYLDDAKMKTYQLNGALYVMDTAPRLQEDVLDVWSLIPHERTSLKKLKRIALRNKSWFNALNFKERRFIDAVVIVVEKIKSSILLKLLAPLIKRLLKASGNPQGMIMATIGEVAYWMRKKGRSLAQNLSKIGQSWGNRSAAYWSKNRGFIQYLTIMDLNNPQGRSP